MDYTQLRDELLDTIIKQSGSDLHLSEGRIPTVRVNGQLIPLVQKQEFSAKDAAGMLKVLIKPEMQEEFTEKQELDFSYQHHDSSRFRGNAFVHQGKIGIVMRLIPSVIKTFEQLNLPPILETFTRKKQGFFLVVGPVGQGKSTTLAAMIELINSERAEHIITIENPTEYIYQPKKSIIDQREVRVDTANFYTGLLGTFRQDVDVILVGEMRGKDTIAAAVTAAETGHLVYSTLHTNNASQTIDRIIDSFPSGQQDQIRIQLAGSLMGIFSQRLIPRVSGGLVPAYELLINNNAIANLIREKRTHEIDTVIETSSEKGMISIERSLADLVRKGEITLEDAYLHSIQPKVLEKLM